MRVRLVLAILAMWCVFHSATAMAAQQPGDPCSELGSTTMAVNHDNLVACMLASEAPSIRSCTETGSPGCIWKAMTAVPKGLIAMWAGYRAQIPPGWAICDGNNGTPDLRDKFAYGVHDNEEPGGTGAHVDTATGSGSGPVSSSRCAQVNGNCGFMVAGSQTVYISVSIPIPLPPYYKLAYIMKL